METHLVPAQLSGSLSLFECLLIIVRIDAFRGQSFGLGRRQLVQPLRQGFLTQELET